MKSTAAKNVSTTIKIHKGTPADIIESAALDLLALGSLRDLPDKDRIEIRPPAKIKF